MIYRTAVSGDETDILKVFEEVAPEVPTAVRPGTKALIEELVASGQSRVAVNADGVIIGDALAKPQDANTLSLYYLGVSKAARGQRISSSLVSELKEIGAPIVTDVRHDNKSSMVERFERWGFVKGAEGILGQDQTKLRWEKKPPAVAADEEIVLRAKN